MQSHPSKEWIGQPDGVLHEREAMIAHALRY